MKNKEYYQKTFSRLTASEDVIQEVMNMEQKKVYRFTKRTVGIAAAAALTLTATGAAYAATDGNFAQLLERITVYINGEEADMGDYEIFEDENGNSQFVVSLDSDEEITTSVTVKPDAALDPDTHYSIDFNTDRMLAQAEEVPFTLWSQYLDMIIFPDHKTTPQQRSHISYTLKLVVESMLHHARPGDIPRFLDVLLSYYGDPTHTDADTAFTLLDAARYLPPKYYGEETREKLVDFAAHFSAADDPKLVTAALQFLRETVRNIPRSHPQMTRIARIAADTPSRQLTTVFLKCRILRRAGWEVSPLEQTLYHTDITSEVFLDNLKIATPWIVKVAGVELLRDQVEHGLKGHILHIATHFSNLVKVSERVVVRHTAGSALVHTLSLLRREQRNEVVVELGKGLEMGQYEISKYIPQYLGEAALYLHPSELDEQVLWLKSLLGSPNDSAVAGALNTIAVLLQHYPSYKERFSEKREVYEARRQELLGLLLQGLAHYRETVRQEALLVTGKLLFESSILDMEEKARLFALCYRKLLFLTRESHRQDGLTLFYRASALAHINRFIALRRLDHGPFAFETPRKIAFFPGTFDPFTLSHKGIVHAIRDLGFEVYLAVDEFSWSKKAQPSLIRRQIVSMSVADEFGVYLFPHDIPVNLATPQDLIRLRQVFQGRDVYLVVGSDVVANASSYKVPPSEGSVHSLNHIVFRRSSDAEGREIDADLSCITGRVVQLQLPTHLEDISSTRIRENIDLGRDISNLVDPTVQDLIYRNSLYLREPQYKQLVRASLLDFARVAAPDSGFWAELGEALGPLPPPDPRDSVFLLRSNGPRPRVLGFLTGRIVNSGELYNAFGSEELANFVRTRTAGRIQLLTGLWAARAPGGNYDPGQLLLTEALTRAAEEDCGYAVWWGPADQAGLDMLRRQGFVPAELETPQPLLLVDMRSPAVLLQNIPTTLKEPFSSDLHVLTAIRKAHHQLQRAICGLYPGTLVLSLNAEVIYHRLVRKLTEENGVPAEPQAPRVLGPKMCVPFGKILRGNAVPNTVTKTIHTDKVFAPDLHSFSIAPFPGYAPLESQIRTIRSFRRPVMLVDDLLHTGNRMSVLDPLFRREKLDIDLCVVGLLSGRGRDLMAARGRKVDSVYYIPNMRAWFVESTMYPFIGGDTVGGARASVPGLTPAVNLILPYAFPKFYKECGREAVFAFSQTCLTNSRDILLALESAYRERYARNLTLSRLSEAVILPLSPDKGNCLLYDASLPASMCLENDLKMLLRMRELLE